MLLARILHFLFGWKFVLLKMNGVSGSSFFVRKTFEVRGNLYCYFYFDLIRLRMIRDRRFQLKAEGGCPDTWEPLLGDFGRMEQIIIEEAA